MCQCIGVTPFNCLPLPARDGRLVQRFVWSIPVGLSFSSGKQSVPMNATGYIICTKPNSHTYTNGNDDWYDHNRKSTIAIH